MSIAGASRMRRHHSQLSPPTARSSKRRSARRSTRASCQNSPANRPQIASASSIVPAASGATPVAAPDNGSLHHPNTCDGRSEAVSNAVTRVRIAPGSRTSSLSRMPAYRAAAGRCSRPLFLAALGPRLISCRTSVIRRSPANRCSAAGVVSVDPSSTTTTCTGWSCSSALVIAAPTRAARLNVGMTTAASGSGIARSIPGTGCDAG